MKQTIPTTSTDRVNDNAEMNFEFMFIVLINKHMAINANLACYSNTISAPVCWNR